MAGVVGLVAAAVGAMVVTIVGSVMVVFVVVQSSSSSGQSCSPSHHDSRGRQNLLVLHIFLPVGQGSQRHSQVDGASFGTRFCEFIN